MKLITATAACVFAFAVLLNGEAHADQVADAVLEISAPSEAALTLR